MNKIIATIYIVYTIILLLFSNNNFLLIRIGFFTFNIVFIFSCLIFFLSQNKNLLFIYLFIYGIIFDTYTLNRIGLTSLIFFIPLFLVLLMSIFRLKFNYFIMMYLFVVSLLFNLFVYLYFYGFGSFYAISHYLLYILIYSIIDTLLVYIFFKKLNKSSGVNEYKVNI